MSMFEVVRGVEGCCLLLDDLRIAGSKPWGGGTVIHAWQTAEKYKAINTCTMHRLRRFCGEDPHFRCSACNHENFEDYEPSFCPKCGAEVVSDND